MTDAVSARGGRPQPVGFSAVHGNTLAHSVSAQLYAAIVDGRIGLGQRLSEAAIAREMGISRGPIREAQRLLEQRGLLVFRPRHGFFVRELTARQIGDLFDLRRVLECFALAQTIGRATDDELQRLTAWRDHLLTLDSTGAVAASDFVEEDLAIHRIICELSGNASLQSAFERVLAELRLALSLINLGFQHPRRIAESHAELIEAILARAEPRAITAMERHLQYSRDVLLRRLQDLAPPPIRDDGGYTPHEQHEGMEQTR